MAYVPSRCDTLLIPTGPSGDHLFVITTDACPGGLHVLANFTKVAPGRFVDSACLLSAGEHPFIVQDSYVLYRSAIIQPGTRLSNMVDGWVYRVGQPATEDLTDKILAGFGVSKFTPKFIKSHLQALGLI